MMCSVAPVLCMTCLVWISSVRLSQPSMHHSPGLSVPWQPLSAASHWTKQISSVQFKMVSLHSEKPICIPPHLASLRSFPNLAFEMVPMFVWLTMAFSRPFQGRSSSPSSFHASLLQWIDGDVFGFVVPTGIVSSSSTLSDLPRSRPHVRVA